MGSTEYTAREPEWAERDTPRPPLWPVGETRLPLSSTRAKVWAFTRDVPELDAKRGQLLVHAEHPEGSEWEELGPWSVWEDGFSSEVGPRDPGRAEALVRRSMASWTPAPGGEPAPESPTSKAPTVLPGDALSEWKRRTDLLDQMLWSIQNAREKHGDEWRHHAFGPAGGCVREPVDFLILMLERSLEAGAEIAGGVVRWHRDVYVPRHSRLRDDA